MKTFFASIVFASLFFSACGQGMPGVEEVSEAAEFSRESTVMSASSELEDNSGYGLEYSAKNVLDLDYSTAWCPSSELNEEIVMDFVGPVEVGTLGIVGGFARDEEIYFENNRIKTLEVWFDDKEAVQTLNFEDRYGMQFFDLSAEKVQKITFKIKEVYAGSKYKDSCIAEMDFWSDYVKQKDSDAAYDFYQEHKAIAAVSPVGVDSMHFFSLSGLGQYSETCGDLYETSQDLTDFFRAPGLYAIFDGGAKEGDLIVMNVTGAGVLVNTHETKIKTCEDGNLVIWEPMAEAAFDPAQFDYEVELYYEDQLIGSREFTVGKLE